jgi:MFS family permease
MMFRFWHFREFSYLQLAKAAIQIAHAMMSVAIGWQVYDITGSTLQLGYVGLVLFLSAFVVAFFAGDFADRHDNVVVLRIVVLLMTLCEIALYFHSKFDAANLPLLYLILACSGAVKSFGGPASAAILAKLVPANDLVRAIAFNSTIWQACTITGPMLGGFVYGFSGSSQSVFLLCAVLSGIGCMSLMLIKPKGRPEVISHEPILVRLAEGLRYVRSNRILLGAISLDLFAVLLGGAVALMPAIAKDVLHAGPETLGYLRSAPAVGAVVVAWWLSMKPIRGRAGSKMFWSVAGFGVATCVFGLARDVWTAWLALAVIGGTDMISVVIRLTLVTARTPENLRGRVSSVSQVFIGASNELGEFESGVTAHWFGTVPAVIIGGIGTVCVVFYWKKIFPELFAADEL